MSRADRRRAPAAARRRPRGAPARKPRLGPGTAAAHASALRLWHAWCTAHHEDPDRPTAAAVHAWTAHNAHLDPGTLTNYLNALKRRAWEQDQDDPTIWRAAEELITAIKHAARIPGTRKPAPKPPQQQPLLRTDLARMASAPGRGGRHDHPDRTTRGRAALLALRAGHDPELLAWALLPDLGADAAAVGPGAGPLVLHVPPRAGGRPATTLTLTDTPAGPDLPSAAAAARDLLRRLPPNTAHVYANTTDPNQPHDNPMRPLHPSSTARSLHTQIASAARRAGIPWPTSHHDAAAAAAALTPEQLALLHELLDPARLRSARDHAERTLDNTTALRGTDVHQLDRPQAARNNRTGADARWTLRVAATKNSGPRTYTLRPTGDPRTCPVMALDDHTRLLDATGHHDGPLLPALDSGGAHTHDRHTTDNANTALQHAADSTGLDKHLTTRSHRTGASTQLTLDGQPLAAVEALTGNTTRNAGRYVRDIRPHVLRL